MSTNKVYKVSGAPKLNAPKLQEALQLAAKTGDLAVPFEALTLTVPGGKVEVHYERK